MQYTFLNFPLKNLWEQFHRPANVYFLGISILQTIRAISITNGTPTTLAPLIAVLIVSGQSQRAVPAARSAGGRVSGNCSESQGFRVVRFRQ